MALNQQDIDVGNTANDGQGDPIRSAFIKTNDNFTQLYSLPNPTPPGTLVGSANDIPGMYAYDSSNFYYCFATYDGTSNIWGVAGTSGNTTTSSISNGATNINIPFANSNITLSVNGSSNIGVVSTSGLVINGTVTTNSLVSGNFIVAGDTISSLGETITITPAGNVIYGEVVINAGVSILGNTTTTEAPLIILANTAANTTVANGAGIQVSQGNYASMTYDSAAERWVAHPRLETASLYINSPYGNGNIFGALNGQFSGTVTGANLFGNLLYGNFVTGNFMLGNFYAGDGTYLFNIQGANVLGDVSGANIANFAISAGSSGTANNANLATYVTATNQPNITSVGALNGLTVYGNSSFTNIDSVDVTAASLITAPYIGTPLTTILRGTLGNLSNAQPNITSVGTLTSLTTAGNIVSSGDVLCGNLYAGNIIGAVTGFIELSKWVTANTQANITNVGNLVGLNIDGALNMIPNGNINAGGSSIVGNIIRGNIIGYYANTILGGKFGANSNAQPNVTSLGNLVSANVDGNAIFGTAAGNTITISGNTITTAGPGTTLNLGYNVIIPGNLQVQGNTTTFNSNTVTTNDLFINVANNASTAAQADGAGLGVGPVSSEYASLFYLATPNTWNFSNPLSVTGNITSTANINGAGVTSTGNITSGATISATGNINSGASINAVGNVYAPSFNWANGNPVISTAGVLDASSINATGNIGTTANVNAGGATFTGNVSGTNIAVTGNVNATYFNGTATSAEYADLAENYLADAQYAPGTVVSFGGPKEITLSAQDLDVLVAGVISTKPAYTMNSGLVGDHTLPVALMGRVPCRVTGKVTRGAMMVSNGDGTARAEKNPVMGSVIGKALESFDGDRGIIEIVVGKL